MSTASSGSGGALSSRQVLWSLLAHYASSMAIGLAVGGFVPLIAVTLEARQVDTVMIGINSAMTSLGVLVMAPYATVMVRRFGASPAMVGGLLVTAVSALAMAFIDNIWAWMVLRFLIGAGVSIHWVVSETWMNAIISERRRGW